MSNNLVSKEAILERLNWRYAVKKFDVTKKISDADWRVLEESLVLAPTSYGLQPFKFIVVTDPTVREKLKPAAWGQTQITDSSHLVVLAYKKVLNEADVAQYIDRISEVRGTTRDGLAEFEQTLNGAAKRAFDGGFIETWNSRQAYIALGFLLETAALIGIDATPMEGFDPVQFNEILGLKDYSAVVVAALGYRDEENDWLAKLPKVRFPNDELIVRI